MPGLFTQAHRASIISAAARNNVPAVYPQSAYARDGGLLSYASVRARKNNPWGIVGRSPVRFGTSWNIFAKLHYRPCALVAPRRFDWKIKMYIA